MPRYAPPGTGRAVASIRQELGLSQEKFGQIIGLSQPTIGGMEIERHNPPTLRDLWALAGVCFSLGRWDYGREVVDLIRKSRA